MQQQQAQLGDQLGLQTFISSKLIRNRRLWGAEQQAMYRAQCSSQLGRHTNSPSTLLSAAANWVQQQVQQQQAQLGDQSLLCWSLFSKLRLCWTTIATAYKMLVGLRATATIQKVRARPILKASTHREHHAW